MQDYVEQACRTESKPGKEVFGRLSNGRTVRLLHAVMGLATEAGELVDALKKHVFYGKVLDTVNMVEEAGDVMWYLAVLLDELGLTFEDVQRANIAKLRARYPNKFAEEQAVDRDLKAEFQALLDEIDLRR